MDARGEPLVVYHGTRAGFTDFAPGLSDTASRTGVPEGAFYFTSSPKVAATYPAETRRRYYEGANIVPVYLSLQNPLVVGYSVPDPDLAPSWDRIPFQGRKRTINEIAHYAREHGYDGVIARSIYDRGYGDLPFAQSVADTYIAFHPTQIKSATGNAGTFDSNDPDIRRNPMNTYDALHAAAGPELQAWMDTHRAAVERAGRYVKAIENVADSIYTNIADTLKEDPTYFKSPEDAVAGHSGIAEELWGEELDRDLYPFRPAWPAIYALALELAHHAFEIARQRAALAPAREYRYGAENRPPGFATVPKGYVRTEPPLAHDPRTRHGVVVYDRPLTEDEVRQYQLVPYMPLAEVAESIVARLSRYGEKYAAALRKNSPVLFQPAAHAAFRALNVYTDVPMDAVYARAALELLREFPAPELPTEPAREYRYGAMNRPPGFATVPKGYVRVDPPVPGETRTRHGVVVYERPLTDDEIRDYQLIPYMPLAEVVDAVIRTFGEYAEENYAPGVRDVGERMVKDETGYALDDLKVYTDVPLGEVYTHVAQELLRRFPA
jgi:hypothetical protein